MSQINWIISLSMVKNKKSSKPPTSCIRVPNLQQEWVRMGADQCQNRGWEVKTGIPTQLDKMLSCLLVEKILKVEDCPKIYSAKLKSKKREALRDDVPVIYCFPGKPFVPYFQGNSCWFLGVKLP